jgi:hypothetical protein
MHRDGCTTGRSHSARDGLQVVEDVASRRPRRDSWARSSACRWKGRARLPEAIGEGAQVLFATSSHLEHPVNAGAWGGRFDELVQGADAAFLVEDEDVQAGRDGRSPALRAHPPEELHEGE